MSFLPSEQWFPAFRKKSYRKLRDVLADTYDGNSQANTHRDDRDVIELNGSSRLWQFFNRKVKILTGQQALVEQLLSVLLLIIYTSSITILKVMTRERI